MLKSATGIPGTQESVHNRAREIVGFAGSGPIFES